MMSCCTAGGLNYYKISVFMSKLKDWTVKSLMHALTWDKPLHGKLMLVEMELEI